MTRSILVSLCLLTSAASADPEHPITAAERSELVTKLGTALERYYVFPDKGRVLEQALRSRLAHGDYAAISTGERLAAAISTELAALVHDKHLEVRYVDAPPPPSPPPSSPASADPEEAAEHRYQNYGVTEVRRLKFNLGYVNFIPSLDQDFDEQRKVVSLTVNIDEGSQYTVKSISFTGNTTAPDEVMRRELLIKEGEVFNASLLTLSLSRLSQLGFFEEIKFEDVRVAPSRSEPKVDIDFKVKEKAR